MFDNHNLIWRGNDRCVDHSSPRNSGTAESITEPQVMNLTNPPIGGEVRCDDVSSETITEPSEINLTNPPNGEAGPPWETIGMSRATWYRRGKPTTRPTPRITQAQAAKTMNVSLRTVQRVARVLRLRPELGVLIESGHMKIGMAEALAKDPANCERFLSLLGLADDHARAVRGERAINIETRAPVAIAGVAS
jgi:hypothetical protein